MHWGQYSNKLANKMDIQYYDTKNNFAKFSPYLDHPIFKLATEFWASVDEGNSGASKSDFKYDWNLSVNGNFVRKLDVDLFDEEGHFISESITEFAKDVDYYDPIRWIAYMDCGDSSSIIMSTLYCLAHNSDFNSIYCLCTRCDRTGHAVISDTYIPPGISLRLSSDTNLPVIYDLIWPNMPHGLNKFEFGKGTIVKSCKTVYEEITKNYLDVLNDPKFADLKHFMLHGIE